jgi:hypothetical protein
MNMNKTMQNGCTKNSQKHTNICVGGKEDLKMSNPYDYESDN